MAENTEQPAASEDSSENKQNSYMVDIASDRVYNNQDEEYRSAFTRWRNAGFNKLGYRFVHDKREHTYVDGGGFADKLAVTAEINSLHGCLQFLSMLMMIYFCFEQFFYMFMKTHYDHVFINRTYYSLRSMSYAVSSEQMYVYCLTRIALLCFPIIVMLKIVKLPSKVAIPRSKLDRRLVFYGFSVALMLFVCFRFFDYLLTYMLQMINIDVTFYTYIQTDTEQAQICYFVCELVLVPILTEILFRGCILQLFRQFGDNFAIFISSLAAALCYRDISKILYMFTLGIALGVFTIRNGSLIPAMVTNLFFTNITLLLNTLAKEKFLIRNRLTEISVCLVMLCVSFLFLIFMRIHFDNPFKLVNDNTELTFQQKVRQLLNSSWTVIWLICMLLSTILSVSFI
ncbi:MAG: CPBP family intramembrane metalloprotease [Ruminococcus sp.]|nr:CPBP family intramembrane metalloprotease [Ruminococcus sp.]